MPLILDERTNKQDYREETREYLLNVAGKTADEIDRYYIPRTAAEKRKAVQAQGETAAQMREKVAGLEADVDRLKWKVFGTNATEDERAL